MEDITKVIADLLDSPEGMERIKGMADMLLGGKKAETGEPGGDPLGSLPFSPKEMDMMVQVLSLLGNSEQNDKAALLYALKPHLSEKRQEKVDKAAKLLRLSALLPLLKEQDLF